MSDFIINSYSVFPTVTGGTLTSDGTYYYRTFTNTSTTGATTDTLSISGAPLTFDYVLVGGGGSVASSFNLTYDAGTFGRYSDAGNYLGASKTFIGTVRAGGAGGVLNGSLTLNPDSYAISLGSAGSGNQKGFDSSAFNGALVAKGGGSGHITADGGPNTSGNAANTVGSGGGITSASSNTLTTQQFGTPGQGNNSGVYVDGRSGPFGAPLFAVLDKGSYSPGYFNYSTQTYSCVSCAYNGWFNLLGNTLIDHWCIESWSGAGGASASGRAQDAYGRAMMYFPGTNPTSSLGGGFETNSSWGGNPTSAGAGVTLLGLTVGQAGDLPMLTRTNALTPANTGCGRGATHGAGSGVLRIRYLRSAVGG